MDLPEMAGDTPNGTVTDNWQAGPMALRMLVGAELRRLREASGITRVDAGDAIRASHSKISRLELGRTGFKQRDVADLLTLYGVVDEGERDRWLALAKGTNAAGWWRDYTDIMLDRFDHYLGLEEAASVIRRYEVQLVPDLLQTLEYARAVILLDHPDASTHQIERRLRLLMRRQQVLHRPTPARLWAIVDEAALRRQIDGSATMRGQLEHLIRLTTVPHVTIQVMPFSVGHAVAGGPITLLRLPARELPDVVFIEQLTCTLCLEKPADIMHYTQVMDRLGVEAEPPVATVAILRRILDQWKLPAPRRVATNAVEPGGPDMTGDDSTFPWAEAEKDLMAGIDTAVPHSARIWNYWLGGKDNYPVDRAAGEEFRKVYPGMVENARANRVFLTRIVRYLAGEAGIRQFLDIGTGLPTEDNTHEVAQRVAPTARIVYVDNDPLVLAHARALLTSTPEGVTNYIDADLREPGKILEAAALTLDLTRPTALILSGILGHIADDNEAHAIVHQLLDGLPPGSYLMVQDGTTRSQGNVKALETYNDSGAVPYNLRDPEAIARFFDGLELLAPGVVPIQLWRPEVSVDESSMELNTYGGVGRKPETPGGRR